MPNEQPTQSELLVGLAEAIDLFNNGDGEAFGRVLIQGRYETWRVRSHSMKEYLARMYFRNFGGAPSSQALANCLNVMCGRAVFGGEARTVHIRLAEHDGSIFLDLCNAEWQAVRIDRSGWQVIDDPPTRFLRRRGMKPLPTPIAGGSVDELREFVNLSNDPDWVMFICWVIAALRPTGPFPVLCVSGEQGSAKSTLCRVARSLIDPNSAPLRSPPRDTRDLMIAAKNGWVLAFDNVSHIPPSLSDALCRLATGGGFATRMLYCDDDEVIIAAQRPLVINGIPANLTNRSDLADRAVTLNLPTLADRGWDTEACFWSAFEDARPRILGALLSVVADGLRRLGSVRIDRLPRMADFAKWSLACEAKLGLPTGAFTAAYAGNRQAGRERSIENEPIATAIVRLLAVRGSWTGTAGELLGVLGSAAFVEESIRKGRGWPQSARALAERLRRIAPDLRHVGVEWRPPVRSGKRGDRVHTLESTGITPSAPSAPSAVDKNRPDGIKNADSRGRLADEADGPLFDAAEDRRPKNPSGAIKNAVTDAADGADGPIPAESNGCDGEVVTWTV